MSFWNYLGLAIIYRHLFGKKKKEQNNASSLYDPTYSNRSYETGCDYSHLSQEDDRRFELEGRMDRLDRELMGIDRSSARYAELSDEIDSIIDELDEIDDMDDRLYSDMTHNDHWYNDNDFMRNDYIQDDFHHDDDYHDDDY